MTGGEGGIRTPDRLAPMPHFECGAFNHSATSPDRHDGAKHARPNAFSSEVESGSREENALIHELERIPPQPGPTSTECALVGASSRRGRRVRQGAEWPIPTARWVASRPKMGGTARRGKNRRSRVASIEIAGRKCGFTGQLGRRLDRSRLRPRGNAIPLLT